MQYASTDALPHPVRRCLNFDAQSIFLKACNAATGSQGRALFDGWSAVKSAGYQANGDGVFVKADGELVELELQLKIEKLHPDDQIFYGWASVVQKGGEQVVDHDGDGWSWQEMEETAFAFLKESRAHGVMHDALSASDLCGSLAFTPDLQKALGIDLGQIGWLVGFRVHDESLWKRIKSRELSMLSIGATGFRTSVV